LQRSVVRLQADVERLKNPWAQPYFNMNTMSSNMPDGPFPKGRKRDPSLAKVTMVSSLERNASGQYMKGHHGNGGRQKHSRNKLAHALVEALSKDFDEFGAAAVRKVRENDTTSYLRIIQQTMPAKIESTLEISVFADMNLEDPQEFLQAYRLARSMIGAPPPMIEAEAIEVEPEGAEDMALKDMIWQAGEAGDE
jgi:hypothetical protein